MTHIFRYPFTHAPYQPSLSAPPAYDCSEERQRFQALLDRAYVEWQRRSQIQAVIQETSEGQVVLNVVRVEAAPDGLLVVVR